MIVHNTRVAGVKLIEPKIFGDQRGFFLETFNNDRYCELLNINFDFVQDNHSRSSQGVLRGLHFQTAKPQGKLVRCVRGEVYDVVVDIRRESPTFKQWVGVYLSEDNKNQFWVPPGLAHGFVVISEFADFEYKCTDYYDPQNEGCLIWNDADIGVEWPVENPLLSAKDKLGKRFSELF
ncbi:dTDP-4-dehydrorhamnose 3,5-epimerase [Serratia proteamaculans]|uniref:dTDP-4-dehydrorhamnose 3,5-epimerase n=1 Tax=Serratia proteamaculans TaxID=28151 RepID=UPI002176F5F8|nr:dTDP-4-dehydrorhamnose 3,5-epimerase [Serratia proteamaculans]CAI1594453.1 dTDP-4-dehydrorhamnose 3,5-epimerase [Serratia proteamaculans]CAI2458040.1 dTDP-4-dehydrorhamnose 3,5-epimerase [Serratia proteamaculans]